MSGEPPVTVWDTEGALAPVRRHARDRAWRSIVFVPVGDGATRRRGSDGFRLLAAVVAIVACRLISGSPAHAQLAVLHFLTPAPQGVRWLVSTVWWVGSVGVIVALGLCALLARRLDVARDVLISGLVAWVASLLIEASIGTDGAHAPNLSTSYLPPIWGWFVLFWLRKKEYL